MKIKPLVTVITSSTAADRLEANIRSVQKQDYQNVQHLIYVDGPQHHDKVRDLLKTQGLESTNLDVVYLPYPTGLNRFNGHRNYAAGVYQADGDNVMFLDDDCTLEPDHVSSCMSVIQSGKPWAFSLRNIVSRDGEFVCQDNCESLGLWPTCLSDNDYLIDLNCYFMPKKVALNLTPMMYVQARPTPPLIEIDRAMVRVLKDIMKLEPGQTGRYTVNYALGGNPLSVQADFFLKGNEKMQQKYKEGMPWKNQLVKK